VIELHRALAPLSDKAWAHIEHEARELLRTRLAARRVVDFVGPLGWEHSAIDLGRVQVLDGRVSGGALVRLRRVRPLAELRIPFELEREELELIDRGAGRVELEPLHEAAKVFAASEDTALFEGYPEAEIPGIVADSTQKGVTLPREAEEIPAAATEALEQLRQAGVSGPYAMALGPEPYAALEAAGGGGYPVLKHVERLLDGPVVWAPSLRGGVVLSRRGGDFRLVCGRDAAIGYLSHDEKIVRLYLEESFSAELNTPEAAVPLLLEVPPTPRSRRR
jgi:uncharacterized linocin/CFP29 family protein